MRGFQAARSNSCPDWAKIAVSSLISVGVRAMLLLLCGIITPITMRGQSPAVMIATTGSPTDLRIAGPGYFVLRDPIRGIVAVTREGDFSLDEYGVMVTQLGMRVQGFSDAGLTQIGDVCLSSSSTTETVVNFAIQGDGTIIMDLSDGSEALVGQILLQKFKVPANLEPFLYGTSFITASAQALSQPAPPSSHGLGMLVAGQLEFPTPFLNLSQIPPASPNATPGILTPTDIPTDLAIIGPGFFVVRDTNSSVCYATRAGAFYVDLNGYLINYAGMRVQGYNDSSIWFSFFIHQALAFVEWTPHILTSEGRL
jgi:flagellar hook protein FlgE